MNQTYQGTRRPPEFKERFLDGLYIAGFVMSSVESGLEAVFNDQRELAYAVEVAHRLGIM